jgi:phosphinothricin acetyltransferase
MRVRLAEAGDAEAIRTIYNLEVLGTEITTFDLVPRTLEEQEAWLARHQGAYPAVVATGPAEVVAGFGSLSPFRSRPGYATTVEDSVYVDRACRGAGVGRAVLQELIGLAGVHGFHAVVARVVGANEASIGLHRSCGFETVGVEREIGRKHGRWLDVVELQRMI